MKHHGSTERPDDAKANWDDLFMAVQHALGKLKCEGLVADFVEDYAGLKQKALVILHAQDPEKEKQPHLGPPMSVVISRAVAERPTAPDIEEIKSPMEMIGIMMRTKTEKVDAWRITVNHQCPHCPEVHSSSSMEEDLVDAAGSAVSLAAEVLIRQAMASFKPLHQQA